MAAGAWLTVSGERSGVVRHRSAAGRQSVGGVLPEVGWLPAVEVGQQAAANAEGGPTAMTFYLADSHTKSIEPTTPGGQGFIIVACRGCLDLSRQNSFFFSADRQYGLASDIASSDLMR